MTARRLVLPLLAAVIVVLAYLVAANEVMVHRSGGCNHIPLTAAGQPAFACSSHP